MWMSLATLALLLLVLPTGVRAESGLVPLAWAGVGPADLPGEPSSRATISCWLFGGAPCVSGQPTARYEVFLTELGPFSIDTRAFTLTGVMVGEVDGNTWTVGLRNVQVTLKYPIYESGLQNPAIHRLSIELLANARAELAVPSSASPVQEVFFASDALSQASFDAFRLTSVRSALVEREHTRFMTFVSGDTVTMGGAMLASLHVVGDAEGPNSQLDSDCMERSTFRPPQLALPDCEFSLEAWIPAGSSGAGTSAGPAP
jgi:hypothetical protein